MHCCQYLDELLSPDTLAVSWLLARCFPMICFLSFCVHSHDHGALLPKGTTTNGRYLLPFKTGAFLAGAAVQPVIIKYSYNWASPAWESIAGKRHVFLMLCSPWHTVTCYQLPVYMPSKEEQRDPAKFAANLRSHMLEFGRLEASSSTFEDKMRFHAMLSGKSTHL